MKLTKKEFADKVAENTGLTKKDASISKIFLLILSISLTILTSIQAESSKEQVLSFVLSQNTKNDEIYIMNSEGKNRLFLAEGTYPRFSPDGRRIAFIAREDQRMQVHLMNTDGSNQKVLKTPYEVAGIDWTPDGRNIVHVGWDGVQNDIFIIGTDDDTSVNLTQSTVNETTPKVSPDGKKIAFSVLEDLHIYLINIDGTGRKALTEDQNHFFESEPDWSPDGQHIVYSAFGKDSLNLYLIDINTRSEEQLTQEGMFIKSPVFSPDGEKIAFSNMVGIQQNNIDIFVMDADGRGPIVNLTNSPNQSELVYDWFDPLFANRTVERFQKLITTWGRCKKQF